MLCSIREQVKRNGSGLAFAAARIGVLLCRSLVDRHARISCGNRNEPNLRDEVERLRGSAACRAAPSEFECAHPCSSLCAVARANDGRECPNRLRVRRFQRGERARIDQR